jgi:hypothetical protein
LAIDTIIEAYRANGTSEMAGFGRKRKVRSPDDHMGKRSLGCGSAYDVAFCSVPAAKQLRYGLLTVPAAMTAAGEPGKTSNERIIEQSWSG